jgi:DnaJ-class molecular chaperone
LNFFLLFANTKIIKIPRYAPLTRGLAMMRCNQYKRKAQGATPIKIMGNEWTIATMKKSYTYFIPTPKTLEELKAQYRKLAMQHHPDRGGNNEAMKAVNNEYDELFPRLKDIHQTKDGETYTARQTSTETVDQFKDLITELMRMDEITIEIIGCFVWVTGNTKPHKERLKALKFQWHSKKIAWYLKPEEYRKRSRKEYELDEIREMYGTSGAVNSRGTVKIDGATA